MYALRSAASPGKLDVREPPPSACFCGFFSSPKISCSIASSCESGSLKPLPEKTLIPLSVHGLCEAEITTPAVCFHPGGRQAQHHSICNPSTRLARILSDDNARIRCSSDEVVPQSASDQIG